MRFPEKEVEIVQLAFKVGEGLAAAPGDFPNPPVPPAKLLAKHQEYQDLASNVKMAEATLRGLHAEKDRVLAELEDWTRTNIRYGELTARHDHIKLVGLGWGPRRAQVRLGLPGEVRGIAVGAQGETTVELSWRRPVEGGKVASYSIQRRDAAGGKWEGVGTIVGFRTRLQDQPRGLQLTYRVVGVNAAGEGSPSAEVSVVL